MEQMKCQMQVGQRRERVTEVKPYLSKLVISSSINVFGEYWPTFLHHTERATHNCCFPPRICSRIYRARLGTSDGIVLGASEGTSLGKDEGASDGKELGTSLGKEEGASEGRVLGTSESNKLGASEAT
jgi:hypothetical protein